MSGKSMSFKDIWQSQKTGLQSLASVGVIGMHMVSGPLVGVAIGWGLDKWLGTSPWFKLVFLLIGIGAGFLNVYIDTKGVVARMNREAARTPGAIMRGHPEGKDRQEEDAHGNERDNRKS